MSLLHHFQSLWPFKKNTLEESVVELIEEHDPEGKEITPHEREMLQNILRFGDHRVSDVMVPRADIIAIEDDITLSALFAMFVSARHTRLPVYHGSMDNVLGFVHIKDLVQYVGAHQAHFSLENVLRKPLFASPSMSVMDLLVKMRSKRVHMAFVLDEHGGTDGLVTLEDLMEEIVGEIEDEHDDDEVSPTIHRDGSDWIVDARALLAVLEGEMGVLLNSAEHVDFDTLGGLIFSMVGRVPKVGEEIVHETGVRFTILDADQRRIRKVRVSKGA